MNNRKCNPKSNDEYWEIVEKRESEAEISGWSFADKSKEDNFYYSSTARLLKKNINPYDY